MNIIEKLDNSKAGKIASKAMMFFLAGIFLFSFFFTSFNLFFTDWRGLGLYGNQGNSYMYDDR